MLHTTGYVSIAPRDIVLSANTEAERKKHETVVNYPLSIEVLKASVDGTALAGATFELYTYSESEGYTLFRSAQTSDAQGRIVFTNDINPASGVTKQIVITYLKMALHIILKKHKLLMDLSTMMHTSL
ncbi:prealbumin-like fold domain-containing protein [Erysipelothrix sp. D19-032]